MDDTKSHKDKAKLVLSELVKNPGGLYYSDEKEITKFQVLIINELQLNINEPFTRQFRKLLDRELAEKEIFALDTLYRIVQYLHTVDGPPQPGWLKKLR